MSDGLAVGLSFAYIFTVVGLAEGLRRAGAVSFGVSRKIIHVGIGSWALPTVLLFHSRWLAAGPPLLFTVVNLLSLRFKWTKAMDAEAGSNAGTVWFPFSFALLLLAFWGVPDGKAAACAGLLVLAWGDAAAALVGQRWGRHRYRAGDSWRSYEGSAAMLLFSAVAISVAGFAARPHPYGVLAVASAAVVATLLEATGRRGSDNLLVPVGTALLLWGFGHIPPIR